jgi:hypothetical protein
MKMERKVLEIFAEIRNKNVKIGMEFFGEKWKHNSFGRNGNRIVFSGVTYTEMEIPFLANMKFLF